MSRMVRDFIELGEQRSLDELIARLGALRASLPAGAREVSVRMAGDDVFGRKLSVSFLRPQDARERAREARHRLSLRFPACA